jgi:RimJ/RimL family protein N-acetyltransferase
MEIEYRKVDRENIEEMKFVAEEDSKIPLLYDSEYTWNELSTSARLDFYKQQITDNDYFEVAVLQDKVVGFHIVKKVPYPPDLFAGVIITLWVSPSVRGKSVATTLKLRAEKWANDLSLAYLQTGVHPNNPQMLSINKKNGFSITQYTLRKKL